MSGRKENKLFSTQVNFSFMNQTGFRVIDLGLERVTLGKESTFIFYGEKRNCRKHIDVGETQTSWNSR